jgi:hypothetical protein
MNTAQSRVSGVADRFSERAASRQQWKLRLEPHSYRVNNWLWSDCAERPASCGLFCIRGGDAATVTNNARWQTAIMSLLASLLTS